MPSDTTILRSRPVAVNFDILTAAQPAEPGGDPPAVPIRFNLFDDVTVTVIFERAKPRYDIEIPENPMDLLGQEFEPVGYNWLGKIVGEIEGHVILATAPNVCAVEISAPGLGTFIVRSFGDVHVVRELGGGGDWECGVVATEDSSSQGAGAESGGVCGIDFVGCDDGSVLDLLVVYTSAARIEAENKGRDIEMEIRDFHFVDANLALSNSQVNTEFRLVGVVEVDYSGPVNQAKIADPWDGILDEIHALRNALRADIVSVAMADSQAPGSGGSYGMGDEAPWRERLAFSHYLWTVGGAPEWTFTHEIGHNLGCSHNRQVLCPCDGCPGCGQQTCISSCPDCENNCDCDHGACDFSYGYLLPPETPLYDTMMSWEAPGGTVEILHFSNPDVLFRSFPTGVAFPSCNSADNAGTIDETRDTVANYRESCDTTDTTNIASHDWSEGQADDDSFSPSISDNGQWIAFASDATTGWFLGGQNGFRDIYIFNRESGLVRTISAHGPGTGGDSFSPAVSGNGQWVAFASLADNLNGVDPNPNAGSEIYVASHIFGNSPTRRRVSVSSKEVFPEGDSGTPSISKNGRYVAFESDAENLLDDPSQNADTNMFRDIFVRDRDGNEDLIFDDAEDSETVRVSISTASVQANGPSFAPSISANGDFVAFVSDATNLVGDDMNIYSDIFLRDRGTDDTSRVSVSVDPFNPDPNGPSVAPSISADGRFVVFESDASNLIDGDNNGFRDIFVRDTAPPGLTFRISDIPGPEEANGDSYGAVISGDRRYVAFYSYADNLVLEDNNLQPDVFVYHLNSGDITRVSVNSAGVEASGGPSLAPAISQNGRFVAFESDAINLVPEDVGGYMDVFFRDRGGTCVGDFNGDSVVDAFDLAILLGAWGPYNKCPPYIPPDLNQDCTVEAADLAILLGNWGLCL